MESFCLVRDGSKLKYVFEFTKEIKVLDVLSMLLLIICTVIYAVEKTVDSCL